jgi:glycolate oxidase iron-sulfur subunit
MKEYAMLLDDDPSYESDAAWLAGHTRDLSELLASVGPRAIRRPVNMKVAYHDACHLAHAQGIRAQPRSLLRAIPGLQVSEIADEFCCGSAGIYNLVQPDAARELGDRKAAAILATDADVVVSTNPGCLMQVQSAVRRAGSNIRTAHLAEILDLALGSGGPQGP